MSEPVEIHAGASASWERTVPDYPYSGGYSLEYVLVSANGRIVISGGVITGSGDTFTITVPMATTATYPAGEYTWRLFATKTGERWHVQTGTMRVVAAAVGPTDARSHAKRMVDALEAMLENKATRDQQEMQINGKALKRLTWPDLMAAYSQWKRIYQDELDAAKVASGLTSKRVVRVKFRGL